jgi:hypothetical protein
MGYRNKIRIKAHNRKLMPIMTVETLRERARNLAAVAGNSAVLEGLQIERCGDNMFHMHQSRAIRYWSDSLAPLNRIGLPRPFAFTG